MEATKKYRTCTVKIDGCKVMIFPNYGYAVYNSDRDLVMDERDIYPFMPEELIYFVFLDEKIAEDFVKQGDWENWEYVLALLKSTSKPKGSTRKKP